MAALKHNHIYKRIKDRPEYYQCIHPDCTHYTHKRHLFNKRATCPKCGEAYTMTNEDLNRVTPHCARCTNSKKAKMRNQIAEQNITGANVFNALTAVLGEQIEAEEEANETN